MSQSKLGQHMVQCLPKVDTVDCPDVNATHALAFSVVMNYVIYLFILFFISKIECVFQLLNAFFATESITNFFADFWNLYYSGSNPHTGWT